MAERIARNSWGLTAASKAPDPCAESGILRIALDCLDETVRPDRSSVLLYDLDGELRFKAWRNLSEEFRRKMEGHSPWSRSEKKPAPRNREPPGREGQGGEHSGALNPA